MQGEELRKQIGAAAYVECSSKTQQVFQFCCKSTLHMLCIQLHQVRDERYIGMLLSNISSGNTMYVKVLVLYMLFLACYLLQSVLFFLFELSYYFIVVTVLFPKSYCFPYELTCFLHWGKGKVYVHSTSTRPHL